MVLTTRANGPTPHYTARSVALKEELAEEPTHILWQADNLVGCAAVKQVVAKRHLLCSPRARKLDLGLACCPRRAAARNVPARGGGDVGKRGRRGFLLPVERRVSIPRSSVTRPFSAEETHDIDSRPSSRHAVAGLVRASIVRASLAPIICGKSETDESRSQSQCLEHVEVES